MIMIIISVREFRLNNLKSSREIDWDFRNDFSSTRSKYKRIAGNKYYGNKLSHFGGNLGGILRSCGSSIRGVRG